VRPNPKGRPDSALSARLKNNCGGAARHAKATIEKKILGKWYVKSFSMVSGNPATTAGRSEVYINDECRKQSYWDFGAERSGIIIQHEFENKNGKCVEEIDRAEYYLNEKGTEMQYKELEEDNPVWQNIVVKQITDKILVLEKKEDVNDDGVEDTMTYTFYRK